MLIPISHNKSWSLQVMAFLGATSYLGASTIMNVDESTDNISYIVARANGAMLRVAVPAIILPTLVAAASRLQRSGIGEYLGMNNRILSHKLIAFVITGLSIAHSVAHYFYNKENYIKQPGITGIAMLACLGLPLGGVYLIHWLKPRSNFSFGLRVKIPHQLGAVAFITLFGVHTTDFRLLPYAGAIGGVWLLDRFYQYYSYQHAVTLKNISRINNTNYLLLRLTIPPHLNLHDYLPGQYVELTVTYPNLNRLLEAPHPFTIVTIDKRRHEIYLAIKQLGQWTTGLGAIAKQKDIPATLWGPYGSPLNSFYKHSQMAIVTAGIGMTPFLAYVFWLVERQQTSPILSLDIALAKIEEVFLWIKALNHPNISRINFIESVNIYISQQKISDIRNELSKMKHVKHLNFIFPEEKEKSPPKPEIKAPAKQDESAMLLESLDDDFFLNINDPDLVDETARTTNQNGQVQMYERKNEAPDKKTPSPPQLMETPAHNYPGLNATGLFSVREQRKSLDINIYTRRMNIDQIFSNTVFNSAAVCAGEPLTTIVTNSAANHGIKLYKESF